MNRKLNILLISLIVLLIATLITVRFLFSKKIEYFTVNINSYEHSIHENFNKLKLQKIDSVSRVDKQIVELFRVQFDKNKAITEKDTFLAFLYLTKKISYKDFSPKYLDCLFDKCSIDKRNESILKEIESKEKNLKNRFGETFSLWYPKLKEQLVIKTVINVNDCDKYFTDFSSITYDNKTWDDFEKFMYAYNSELKKVEAQNKNNEWQFSNQTNNTKRQLNSNAISYFENKLSSAKATLLKNSKETRTYNSNYLGVISYEVNLTIFDNEKFQNMAEDAFEEQWKYNFLRTGATPYSNCYGSSNYCSGWNCSQIKVKTSSGGGDVLVTIKNNYGKVVRHAYIKAGNSFTFDVTDGRYQVFFYSGKGWNPNKKMTSSTCNYLRGGFVSNEDVTKDNYISLYGQIMTYELIMQVNGNFNTKPSSKSEAF
jgi:flagellar basal body-associated protein FliL